MKKAKLLLLFVSITFLSLEMTAQSVEGYMYHGTDGSVSLYYKQLGTPYPNLYSLENKLLFLVIIFPLFEFV